MILYGIEKGNAMATVELKNVSKAFSDTLAVSSFSLRIEDGEFVALVGPSGCGKTTTLRMIAGLEEPSQGEIFINDKPMGEVNAKDRNVAMVFQNFALYPHMTVKENMSFGLKMKKLHKTEIENKIDKAAYMLELSHLLNRKPYELSGGEQQRVALGRALVRDPKVFLFDEPLSNLDAKMRYDMRQEIRDLYETIKGTFIYVTHDQVEAMSMADRIVVMHKGEIMQVDTPQNLYNHPTNLFVAKFIGSPPINSIKVTVREEDTLLFLEHPAGKLPLDVQFFNELLPYIDKEIFIGIRPEDLFFAEEGIAFFPNYTEHMGGFQLVHGFLLGHQKSDSIIVSVDQFATVEKNVKYFLSFHKNNILFFDAKTGNNIVKRQHT